MRGITEVILNVYCLPSLFAWLCLYNSNVCNKKVIAVSALPQVSAGSGALCVFLWRLLRSNLCPGDRRSP